MYKALDISGLLINLIGVYMLFRYGMPYRVETKGEVSIILEHIETNEVELDKKYRSHGLFGLAMAVLGVLLQVLATLVFS